MGLRARIVKTAPSLDWWKARLNRAKQFSVLEDTSVFVPPAIMRELWAHAIAGAPNEACGLIGFKNGVAEKFLPCENAARSVSQFDLRLPDPMALIDLHEAGYEVGCFHTHPVSWAEPSLTDLLNVGAWAGCPYLILAVTNGDLRRWRITRKGEEVVSMEPEVTFAPERKNP